MTEAQTPAPSVTSRTERIPVGSIELCVHRCSPSSPDGRTALLLHGFMDAGGTWDHVAHRLCRAGFDVVAPDLRGFGASDWIGPGGYYHFADYVIDVSRLVEKLDPERLFLVGHSMGGAVASLFTGTFPERVERLAILEGLGPVAMEPSLAPDRMQSWLRGMKKIDGRARYIQSVDQAAERLAIYHPNIPRAVLVDRAHKLMRRDDSDRLVWAFDPMHRTTSPSPFNVHAFCSFLQRITCPTLFVSGGPTGWHPPDEAERLEHIAGVERVELSEAGHMMHWTSPERLAEELLAFFAKGA